MLQTVPGATDAANTTFAGIRPSFPVLAANLANFGRIGVIYHKSIEQALVIFPALMAALITVGGGVPADEGGKLDFKVDLGDPPPCSTGFIPPPLIRSPADTTLRDLPTDLYCKTAQNDPTVVRGARNYPCQEFPGKRAPTIQLCRDPRGLRADRQQPVARSAGAVRHTGRRIARNITAAQQVPVHPAAGGLRPGSAGRCSCRRACSQGRARRRTRRSRCRCRRTTTGPPPPLPFYAPPDQVVPPYGRPPPPPPGAAAAAGTARGRRRRPRRRRCPPEAPPQAQWPRYGDVRSRTACSSTRRGNWRLRRRR